MSITAPSLVQAREALASLTQQRQQQLQTIHQQGRKIVDLENEVQRLATSLASAQQYLADAKVEIQSLRSQVPDASTQRAFQDLTDYLSGSEEVPSSFRLAA